jgi:O-antigen ligase
MMVNFIFVGLFVAKARNALVGWSIVVASVIFLFFCEAKSAVALFPLVLILSWAAQRVRSPMLCGSLIFAPVIVVSLFTIGSLHFEAIRAINAALLSDPTFTGRNDIWQFAIDHIGERPWIGHGFGAFWETPLTYFKPVAEGSQVTSASHAHNAFVDLALTIGIIGLGLAVLWTMVLPFRDFQRCKNAGGQRDLTGLFLRIWMFAVYTCSFESVLFDRGDPHWFTMLVAMFGLRYLSTSRLNR